MSTGEHTLTKSNNIKEASNTKANRIKVNNTKDSNIQVNRTKDSNIQANITKVNNTKDSNTKVNNTMQQPLNQKVFSLLPPVRAVKEKLMVSSRTTSKLVKQVDSTTKVDNLDKTLRNRTNMRSLNLR